MCICQVFTDGITNKLLGCYLDANPDEMVLVRVNGEGSDIIIDRNEEQETFKVYNLLIFLFLKLSPCPVSLSIGHLSS